MGNSEFALIYFSAVNPCFVFSSLRFAAFLFFFNGSRLVKAPASQPEIKHGDGK